MRPMKYTQSVFSVILQHLLATLIFYSDLALLHLSVLAYCNSQRSKTADYRLSFADFERVHSEKPNPMSEQKYAIAIKIAIIDIK